MEHTELNFTDSNNNKPVIIMSSQEPMQNPFLTSFPVSCNGGIPPVSCNGGIPPVNCDGRVVSCNLAGLMPRKLHTGLQIVVPRGQVCYFMPTKGKKLKKVMLEYKPYPQPLVLKPYNVYRMKREEVLGELHFVTVHPFVTLKWL